MRCIDDVWTDLKERLLLVRARRPLQDGGNQQRDDCRRADADDEQLPEERRLLRGLVRVRFEGVEQADERRGELVLDLCAGDGLRSAPESGGAHDE